MFRLIKLAAYMLLGYALYELVLGVLEGSGGVHPRASTEAPAPARKAPSAPPAISGGGGQGYGAPATVGGSTIIEGSDGSRRRRRTGRGVVSR